MWIKLKALSLYNDCFVKVTHWHSPNFHAYYPTANSWPGILADILSDAIGCVGFSWVQLFIYNKF